MSALSLTTELLIETGFSLVLSCVVPRVKFTCALILRLVGFVAGHALALFNIEAPVTVWATVIDRSFRLSLRAPNALSTDVNDASSCDCARKNGITLDNTRTVIKRQFYLFMV